MEAAVLLCIMDAVMLERIHYGSFLVVGADADFPFRLYYLVRTKEVLNWHKSVFAKGEKV